MTPAILSEALFAVGRRRPSLPLAFLRAIPLSVIHALRRPGIRATLRQAVRSPYYREAFAAAGVDATHARGLEDLGEFFLPPEAVKQWPDSLVCATPELAIESSGTSGQVTKIFLSRAELEYSARQGNLLFAAHGIGVGDRLLCTLDLAWGLGSLLAERGVRHTGMFAMVVGRVDPLDAYRRLHEYMFDVVVSDPFWLARLTEIARDHGRPRHRMKLLVGGGEGITPRLRTDLERFWEAPVAMTYASTEAATVLGFECLARSGYHVNEFDFVVEVDRPDETGYGEIVFTTVNRGVMPLVRYRTGDVARWVDGPCACGLPFRRLSPIRGRRDEQVSCAWGNVHPDFFASLLADVPGVGGDWQVAIRERDLVPVAQFRLEIARGGPPYDQVAAAVLRALERMRPDAWLTYRQRLIDVDFAFFRPGTLRRQRKLLRLVDERGVPAPEWAVGTAVTSHR